MEGRRTGDSCDGSITTVELFYNDCERHHELLHHFRFSQAAFVPPLFDEALSFSIFGRLGFIYCFASPTVSTDDEKGWAIIFGCGRTGDADEG